MPTGTMGTGSNMGLYLGMTLEVLTTDNKPIFIGRIADMDEGSVDIAGTSGGEVPPVLYNTGIRLRGFLPGMRPIMLSGSVCGSTEKFWRVDQLKSLYVQENRGFFRQHISVEATVMCVNAIFQPENGAVPEEKSGTEPCHLLDISGSGLRMSCRRAYDVDDWLFVMDADLWPADAPFSFTCRVRRTENAGWAYVYGCQFEGLEPREQDRLLRVILQIQRKDLQMQRGSRT